MDSWVVDGRPRMLDEQRTQMHGAAGQGRASSIMDDWSACLTLMLTFQSGTDSKV